jgi:hypothetical protein
VLLGFLGHRDFKALLEFRAFKVVRAFKDIKALLQ